MAAADQFWNFTLLRYFNPVGNHNSHLIGDDFTVTKKSMNLFTAIMNSKVHKRTIKIFGNSYPTRDGTCIRDYIHVIDIANAHIKSAAAQNGKRGLEVFNLGTGQGYSVLEIVNKFNELGLKIEYEIVEARKGDVAEVYADCSKAKNILKWHPEYSLDNMVQDTVRYFLYQIRD
jgi:UDP-glucose 4-epimerase